MKTIKHIGSFVIVAGLLLAGLMAMLGTGSVAALSPHTPAACTPGPHSGHITADETWCLADSPHRLSNDVIVDPGVVLTIEAGVTVRTDSEKSLYVEGDLQALGAATQPITFTSAEDDEYPHWAGIRFDGGAGHLQHVTVRYATSGVPFVAENILVSDTTSGQVLIEDSILEKNVGGWGQEYGLHVKNGAVTMRDTTIREIGGGGGQDAAVFIEGADSQVTLSGNHLVDNTRNVVALGPHAMMHHDATLARQAEMDAYVLQGSSSEPDFTVPAGVALTVEPGVTVKAHAWNTSLWVQGNLQALGTASEPITFTSEEDSAPNQWGGIYFDGGSGDLQHVLVRYGGAEDPRSDIAVVNTTSGQVHVADSELRNVGDGWAQEFGVYVENGHLNMANTLITEIGAAGGGDVPIFIKGPDSQVTLTNNQLTNNDRRNVIALVDNAMTNNATVTLTPQMGQDAFVLGEDLTIPVTATWTIEPGSRLEAVEGVALWVKGNLQAVGSPTKPILITSDHDSADAKWRGLRFDGGSGHLKYASIRYANADRNDGHPVAAVEVADSGAGQVLIQNSFIEHVSYWTNCKGLVVRPHGRVRVENTVFRDLGRAPGSCQSAAVRVEGDGEAQIVHATFAANPNCGVFVQANATATLTNTIFSENRVGVEGETGSQVHLTNTLWDNNDTNTQGAVNEVGHVDGPAAFDLDGYHLTEFSAALGQGVDAGLSEDIDGEARPQPAGSAPDLGADEAGGGPASGTTAEKVAFDPKWVYADSASGLPKGHLQQRYLIRLFNDEPTAQDYSVTDTLPDDFQFAEESHNRPMTFANAEPALTWQSQEPLAPRDAADIFLTTASAVPGSYTNRADVQIGSRAFHLEVSGSSPLIPPIITHPYSFRHCTAEEMGGAITVEGASQNNAIVRIYENGEEVTSTTADADGYFHVEYPSTRVGYDDLVTLTARTCNPDTPTECSEPSEPVELTASDGYWCPQASSWSAESGTGPYSGGGSFSFVPPPDGGGGGSATQVIGPRHADQSTIRLYVPDGHQDVTVEVDGNPIPPISPVEPPYYDFPIPPHPVYLCLIIDGYRTCIDLIDPDGYVFAVTQGFDPDNPTLHAVQGVTVTCMAYIPEWGGWVPWPAELFDNQINPQVTGPDGYFSFFTPPGDYYLQVDAIDGYQSWRSPVIHVISDVVHMNVPYTPLPEGSTEALSAQSTSGVGHEVLLTDEGPQPQEITINQGDWIEWRVPQDPDMSAEDRMALEDAPRIRLLSDLDPVQSTDGWDGGMMTPDQRYLRGFASAGDFAYSDGNGHTGVVHVTGGVPAWRFRGYACRGPVAYPYDHERHCANGEPLAGVTLRLLGQNEGDPQPVFEKTTTSDGSGFFNFYMIQPWVYDTFTLEVEPPPGLAPADAWSADGTVLDAGTIQWRDAGPWVHRNAFYLDEPTPTPSPTPTPTPSPTPATLYLPMIRAQ